jgi:hypothetical protein
MPSLARIAALFVSCVVTSKPLASRCFAQSPQQPHDFSFHSTTFVGGDFPAAANASGTGASSSSERNARREGSAAPAARRRRECIGEGDVVDMTKPRSVADRPRLGRGARPTLGRLRQIAFLHLTTVNSAACRAADNRITHRGCNDESRSLRP